MPGRANRAGATAYAWPSLEQPSAVLRRGEISGRAWEGATAYAWTDLV